MKWILTALTLFAAATASWGQVPSEDFEVWSQSAGAEAPPGWSPSVLGAGKTDSAHGGRYAASLWVWYAEVSGYMVTGGAHVSPYMLEDGGVPIDFKPSALTGYYRFEPGETLRKNDSAVVYVMLKRFNGETGRRDTIGYAMKLLGPSATYIPFTVDIRDYGTDMAPDSIVIALVAADNSLCTSSNGLCCYFSVDDLRLLAPSGVSYDASALFATDAGIAPNPLGSTGAITWNARPGTAYTLRVFSLSGALVRSVDGLAGGTASIDRAGLPAGEYLFQIHDAAGALAGRGRFIAR
jgi:hypothetical protein